jgi:hypothetical protein
MTVSDDAGFIANRLVECLAERNPNVFNRVVGINVEIALGNDVEINLTMPRDLVEHMLKKREPRIEFTLTAAIQTQRYFNLRL